jgi:hypothetical protein
VQPVATAVDVRPQHLATFVPKGDGDLDGLELARNYALTAEAALSALFSHRCCPLSVQRSSSATAAGNARSAARVAVKLAEPSDGPAGRQFAAAP